MTRFGVIGIQHPHVFELVEGLLNAGAVEVSFAGDDGPLLDLYSTWRPESTRVDVADLFDDEAIDLVVVAGVPAERADVAVEALEAGKAVLSDKPGVTTFGQLDAVMDAVEQTGNRWWVLFSERFTNRAVGEAIRRVHAGEIGQVVDVVGLGPHTLSPADRPEWFWDLAQAGSILVDIGSHQVDQFCAIADPNTDVGVTVESASVGNVACAEHPETYDVGRMRLAGGGVIGSHRVDYLTAPGLGTWGDCRLMVTGTEGTLEVRANVDPAGVAGGEHLIRVDACGTRRIDCSSVDVDWAERLLVDLADSTDTLMSTAHVERVCRLTLEADAMATRWPTVS